VEQAVGSALAPRAVADPSDSLANRGASKSAASWSAIFAGAPMLIGAFIACVSAALGGRLRDEHL
jgi:hypothetical protein